MLGIAELARSGKTYHQYYGWLDITKDTLDSFVKNFNSMGNEIPIKHASHESDAPAAGWVKSMEVVRSVDDPKEFSVIAQVNWTKDATEDIKEDKYRYISPEFVERFKDKRTGEEQGPTMTAAALLNEPQLDKMMPVFAFSSKITKDNELSLHQISLQQSEVKHMDMVKIREALGLEDSAELEDVLMSIKEMRTKMDEYGDMTPEMIQELKGNHETELKELSANHEAETTKKLAALSKELSDSVSKSESLQAELDEKNKIINLSASEKWVDGLISGSDGQRKLIPAQRDTFIKLHQESPKQAEAVVNTMVDLGPLNVESGTSANEGKNLSIDQQKAIKLQQLKDEGVSAVEAAGLVAKEFENV